MSYVNLAELGDSVLTAKAISDMVAKLADDLGSNFAKTLDDLMPKDDTGSDPVYRTRFFPPIPKPLPSNVNWAVEYQDNPLCGGRWGSSQIPNTVWRHYSFFSDVDRARRWCRNHNRIGKFIRSKNWRVRRIVTPLRIEGFHYDGDL